MAQSSYRSRYPDVEALRAAFPTTKYCTYLNHAVAAPMPDPVRAAMSKFIADRGVLFDRERRYEHVGSELRGVLAWLINGTPQEIAFLQNSSEGLNIVANALPLHPGDNILLCDTTLPSNVYPWTNLQHQGIETRCIPHDEGGLTVEALDRHADDRTRVVAVSSVEFVTGFRSDLQALGAWCRERGTRFVVDGTQSVGVAPLDVQACHIDFLCCDGSTWLMGPPGQGFIYCRQELVDELGRPFAGHFGVDGQGPLHHEVGPFQSDAWQLEFGTANVAGQLGILAAVRFVMGIGIPAIERWTLHLTDLLIEEIQQCGCKVVSNLNPRHRSAIVVFRVPGSGDEALDRLADAKIVVSQHEQTIRVSPHCYNTEEEIARVGEVLGEAPHGTQPTRF